jgi:hypothetical protein
MKKIANMQQLLHRGLLLLFLGLLFAGQPLFAQTTNTEFFMTSSVSKLLLNPAKRPENGYIGVPGITNAKLDFNTKTLTLDRFIFPGMGENGKAAFFMNEAIDYNRFMNGISANNFLHADADWTPIGAGFYLNKLFLSMDLSVRAKAKVNLPGSIFSFLKEGLNAAGDEFSYNFKDASANAFAFAQAGVGVSYPLHPSFVVGAKVKFLLGIANAQVEIEDMNLNFAHDRWSVQSQASMLLSYPGQRIKYDSDGVFSGIQTDGPRSYVNGSGVGLDLGLTFAPDFLNKFTFSAALVDLGSIRWNKNIRLATNPSDVLITDDSRSSSLDNFGDVFDELSDSMEDFMAFREQGDNQTATTRLGSRFNLGVEYAASSKLNLGFLATTRYDPVETVSEYTLGAAWYPAAGFEAGLSYSFVYSRFQTFGLAIHIGSGFFVSADYFLPTFTSSDFTTLPIPVSMQAFNLQIGCVVPLKKK